MHGVAVVGHHVADACFFFGEIVLLLGHVVLDRVGVHLWHLDICNLCPIEGLVVEFHGADLLLFALLGRLLEQFLLKILAVAGIVLALFCLWHKVVDRGQHDVHHGPEGLSTWTAVL